MKKSISSVLLTFLKVGLIGFGGGAALIPVIEHELVERKAWMRKEEFDSAVIVSSISPASLPVSLCAIWNSRYSLLSAFAYALPGPLLYMVLLTGFALAGPAGKVYIQYASVGLIAFVILLLYKFIVKNYKNNSSASNKKTFAIIAFAAFVLSCGKTITDLIHTFSGVVLNSEIYSIGMIKLMLAAFFIIGFIGRSKSKAKLSVALAVAGLFVLAAEKTGMLWRFFIPISIAMGLLVLGSIFYDSKKNKHPEKKAVKLDYKPLRNLGLFIAISAILIIFTQIISSNIQVWDFAGKVFSSSLTSFGGGEAYFGVSREVFVETKFIQEDFFNGRILGIANAMPGPVLVS
ncbi:MAG: chromate transporter, partial [Clostridia bacterium]|nr:chromate transporter [Clostridia bacterium]